MSDMRSWVQVSAGDICWQIDPVWQHHLLGPEGLRLDEWLRTGQATIVKHGAHRTVYHVTLPGLSCYVKLNRLTGYGPGCASWFAAARHAMNVARPCKPPPVVSRRCNP